MIVRIWHGWTSSENADKYENLLQTEIFEGIKAREINRFLGIELLRREVDVEVEFVTMMRFESLQAVKDFAGEDYEIAVVPEKARELLKRYDARSQHYQLRVANSRIKE